MARTRNLTSVGKTVAAIGLASAAAFGLGACGSGGNPGTAFIVNGKSFSEQALTETVTEWAQVSGVEVDRDEMAAYQIEAQRRLQAAEEVGVALPEEAVQATMDEMLAGLPTDLTFTDLSAPVRDMFTDLLLINSVRSGAVGNEEIQALDEAIMSAQVKVNPRYGTFTDSGLQPPGDLPGSVSGGVGDMAGLDALLGGE